MGKLKGTSGGGGPRASKAQAAAHKQQKSKATILASRQAPSETPTPPPGSEKQRDLSVQLRQTLLNVFSDTFASILASPDLHDVLQTLKRALFERDFSAAFAGEAGDGGVEESAAIPPLDAYAARWSPTRALCYASVLGSPVVQEHWNAGRKPASEDEEGDDGNESSEDSEDDKPLRMVAIGGGAAEVVAFASVLANGEPGERRTGDLVLVDSGPWASVVGRLQTTMTTPKHVAQEEDEDEREDQPALVEPRERLAVDVRQLDILTVGDDDMAALIGGAATTLVTLFFTLNELFTAGGLGAAATFLLRLTNAAPVGTVLLVVDSPGSYAEIAVGTQAKRYPMKWLLDRFLTQDTGAWSKVHEDDSTWFRLTSALTYPIRLEDMRYQTHLYVKM